MDNVALFRNLNNGQRGHPSSDHLARAFAEVGARGVRLVRGNGTVVFTGPSHLAHQARVLLVERAMWDDIVCVRDLDWLGKRLIDLPPVSNLSRLEFTFFDQRVVPELPISGRRCEVIDAGAGFAVTLNLADHISDGTPTVERALGVRATSRGLATLQLV